MHQNVQGMQTGDKRSNATWCCSLSGRLGDREVPLLEVMESFCCRECLCACRQTQTQKRSDLYLAPLAIVLKTSRGLDGAG